MRKILISLVTVCALFMQIGCMHTDVIEEEPVIEEDGWYPTPPKQYIQYFDK